MKWRLSKISLHGKGTGGKLTLPARLACIGTPLPSCLARTGDTYFARYLEVTAALDWPRSNRPPT